MQSNGMRLIFATAVMLCLCAQVNAGDLSVEVVDKDGKPLSNIIVELIPEQKLAGEITELPMATMQQIDQRFVPHILAVAKGTEVSFPDTDTVRHHVYSFSSAKTFEIAIYKEDVKRSILFDQAGLVELGCNIHDWMLGYIYVADSRLFLRTNENAIARFSSLPRGNYSVKIWHPRLDPRDIQALHEVSLSEQELITSIRLAHPIAPSLDEFDSVNGLSEYE